MVFEDRRERLLAAKLTGLRADDPIVVAPPRGGVPVGFEVARALRAPLEILAVRKLGAPGNPEFGVGTIAEDGTAVLDADTADRAARRGQPTARTSSTASARTSRSASSATMASAPSRSRATGRTPCA